MSVAAACLSRRATPRIGLIGGAAAEAARQIGLDSTQPPHSWLTVFRTGSEAAARRVASSGGAETGDHGRSLDSVLVCERPENQPALAEYERELVTERVNAGIAAPRAQGGQAPDSHEHSSTSPSRQTP